MHSMMKDEFLKMIQRLVAVAHNNTVNKGLLQTDETEEDE